MASYLKKKNEELQIFTEVRKLCSLVYEIMEKAPKRFRYTLVKETERLALDSMEKLYRSNRVKLDAQSLKENPENRLRRRRYQEDAMTDLELMDSLENIAVSQGCILVKQYGQLTELQSACRMLLAGWHYVHLVSFFI